MKTFDCQSCGAPLEFKPEASELQCPYCDTIVPIPKADSGKIEELGYHEYLRKARSFVPSQEVQVVVCKGCGAETDFSGSTVASRCAYCDNPLVSEFTKHQAIKPRSLLPFKVEQEEALAKFKEWLASRWFAPNALKKAARRGDVRGCYVPFWTYDSSTISRYTGERGDAYYETETYTDSEGKTQTRQVRKIRWSYASGTVSLSFDDILILATESLPRSYADELEPWDLENLKPYREEFLAGFEAQRYDIDLETGFDRAKVIMDGRIHSAICRDIGGDEQRVHSVDTSYNNITFKHILLPVWISSYRFKETVYRFLVNGRSGEVQGERPYSWIKILLFIATIIAIIYGIFVWTQEPKQHYRPNNEIVVPQPLTPDSGPASIVPPDAPPEGE